MKETSSVNEKVTILRSGKLFRAVLRSGFVETITEEGEAQYECDMVKTKAMAFEDENAALQYFTDNFDLWFSDLIEKEEAEKAKEEASIAKIKLANSDYKVIKAAEAYLAEQGIVVRPDAETLRETVRKAE